jgi:hypothetical protein
MPKKRAKSVAASAREASRRKGVLDTVSLRPSADEVQDPTYTQELDREGLSEDERALSVHGFASQVCTPYFHCADPGF